MIKDTNRDQRLFIHNGCAPVLPIQYHARARPHSPVTCGVRRAEAYDAVFDLEPLYRLFGQGPEEVGFVSLRAGAGGGDTRIRIAVQFLLQAFHVRIAHAAGEVF